ncbi:hypothetical protein [Halosimplex salinum]|uniref:hypothetical protein n=1 Tax=Halosimplex salinum TaxID=1710538 RepID=UPI000F4600EF|nr:hypothetical protein [Halosimplex salinum]
MAQLARFRLTCETCPYEADAASVADALTKERAHKRQARVEHRVTIERRTESPREDRAAERP